MAAAVAQLCAEGYDVEAVASASAGRVTRDLGACDPEVVELGHVLTGAAARETDDGLVTFLSAGLGVQDAAAAWSIHRGALQQDIGSTLNRTTNWTTT